MTIDYRCYLVTSGTDRRTVDVAAAAAADGAGIVQVRAKELDARAYVELAAAVATAVVAANPEAAVVVDDRCDVALGARLQGAPVAGVHLGQDDVDPAVARAILGPDAVVGWTTGTLELVELANSRADDLTYVGCGPFRATPTKDSGRTPIGLQGYPALAAASRLPMVAIGDVTPADVAQLRATGIAGVCMVRAVMEAHDPGAVVRATLAEWERAGE